MNYFSNTYAHMKRPILSCVCILFQPNNIESSSQSYRPHHINEARNYYQATYRSTSDMCAGYIAGVHIKAMRAC